MGGPSIALELLDRLHALQNVGEAGGSPAVSAWDTVRQPGKGIALRQQGGRQRRPPDRAPALSLK
jgi:hypothetical protein